MYKAREKEMLASLQRLVKYNSEKGEALPGMPFGKEPAACLQEALQIAEEIGFATHNMDNYCGWAEMGEGDEIVGIVGHLDIVPVGNGWDTDPLTVTVKGDRVYGRGVSDDKGAVIASMYAMKELKEEGIPMKKRVRLLMGTNEETGSECMKYYAEHGEPISVGFTPDGDFPGIYGEKGGLQMLAKSKSTKIVDVDGGFVSNAVCDHCVTKVSAADVNRDALNASLKASSLTAFSVKEEEEIVTIDAQGVAAHASTPHLGVNAAGITMQALKDAGMEDPFVDFYLSHIGNSCDGEGIGLKIEDAYGPLTLNNGIIRMEDGVISATIDIRYPVTFTPDQIREKMDGKLEDENGVITVESLGSPLFIPRDSKLVETLLAAYQKVTGDMETQPMVIGGGTYAKSVPGIMAFGCEFPATADTNHIHDKNESLLLDEWQQQVEIYKEAIKGLLEI